MTKTIPAAIARTQLGQILDLVKTKRARFVISRNGEPAALILSIEDYLESTLETPKELAAIQKEARKRGLDLLSMEDINAEIDGYRTEQLAKKKKRA
jgi:prevent-host-death family protein